MLNFFSTLLSGYPPADHVVREYLTEARSRHLAYDRACSFLEALFKHLTGVLRGFDHSLDYEGFTQEFRARMTDGQKMTGHNKFRQDFYSQVIQKAKQLVLESVSDL